MKKLMTMLAAVGMAFGLFADEPVDPGKVTATSFEVADNEFDENDTLKTGDETEWVEYTAEGATLAKGAANDYSYTEAGGNNPRYVGFSGTDTASLSLKTTLGNPLLRTLTDATVGDNGLYFDQLVKFTAFDDDPTIGANDKLALFVRDLSEGDVPVPATNLYAVAGHWDGATFEADEEYDLGEIDDLDAWHRVTIKAVKATTTSIGFQIFVDGVVRAADHAGYTGAAVDGLTAEAKALNVNKYLLPVRSQTGVLALANVGFDGQGSIDDLSVTTKAPFPACETKFINIVWDANVTKISYKVGEGGTYSDDITVSPITEIFEAGKLIFIKPTFATNRGFDTISGMDFDDLGNGEYKLVPTADKLTATIVTKDATPRIEIGGETYPNFKEACAAIKPAAGQTVTVELLQNVDVDWDETEGTDATFNAGEGEIVIDLKGKTITGTAVAGDNQYVLKCSGAVTIKDTVGTGKIKIADGAAYGGVVKQTSGCLTVTGGTFEGKVDVSAADASIAGGSFAKASNTADETFSLADKITPGFKLGAFAGDYWEVVAKAKYTISVTGAANASVKINNQAVTSLELTEGEDYEIVVTPNDNYEYKADGTYDPFIRADDGTLTKSGKATATAAFAAANATAIEWTITYYNDDGTLTTDPTVFVTETYSVATRETQKLNAGTKDGFTFKGWKDEDENPAEDGDLTTYLSDKTGNLELYGTWESAGPDWPDDPTFPSDADDDVKAKYADWVKAFSVTQPASADAFLLNVDPAQAVPELKITSIEVADGVATITVSADGADLAKVNGVLFLEKSDDLKTWTSYQKPLSDEIESGVWTVEVEDAPFMKAKVGFKDPDPVE